MEVDAILLLILSVAATPVVGAWVLAIGLMRYAFVVAAVLWPWMNRRLPYRYWRKVATAVAGIALALAVSQLLAPWGLIATVAALLLLIESFGRDVIWLIPRRDHAGL